MRVTVRHNDLVVSGHLLCLEDDQIVCVGGKRLGYYTVVIENGPGIRTNLQGVPERSIEITKEE